MTHEIPYRHMNEHEFRQQEQVLRQLLLEKFLQAMREDLSEWLSSLSVHVSISADNFLNDLEDGIILCQTARLIQRHAEEYAVLNNTEKVQVPTKPVFYKERGAYAGSFVARDNVANFIAWCRDLGIPDVVIFESDDLVLQKNEKSVILTLMDVARKAYIFGVQPPEIVRFEKEIDEEIDKEKEQVLLGKPPQKPRDLEEDNNLDTMVRNIVNKCTCCDRFPIKKLADGKYQVGRNNALIFVRIMRKHVMVRVGGGWDTFDHYITKHDPCRTKIMGTIDSDGHSKTSLPPGSINTKQIKTEHTIATSTDNSSMCSSSSDGSEGIDRNNKYNDCYCGDGMKRKTSYKNALANKVDHGTDTTADFTKSIKEIDQKLKLLENNKRGIEKVMKDPNVYDNKSDRWLRSHLNTIKQHNQGGTDFVNPANGYVMQRGYTDDNIDRKENKSANGTSKSGRKQKENNPVIGVKASKSSPRKSSNASNKVRNFGISHDNRFDSRDVERASNFSPLSSSDVSLDSCPSVNSVKLEPIRRSCNDISTQTDFDAELMRASCLAKPRPIMHPNDVTSKIPRPVMKRSKTSDGLPSVRKKTNVSLLNASNEKAMLPTGRPAIRREKSDITGRKTKKQLLREKAPSASPTKRKDKPRADNPVRRRNGP